MLYVNRWFARMVGLQQKREANTWRIAGLEGENRRLGERWTDTYLRESRWSDLERMTDDQVSIKTTSDAWKTDQLYQRINIALANTSGEKTWILKSLKRAMEERTMTEAQYHSLVDTSIEDLSEYKRVVAGK